MFIQTEATPNPATLKFLPGRIVMGSGTLDPVQAGTMPAPTVQSKGNGANERKIYTFTKQCAFNKPKFASAADPSVKDRRVLPIVAANCDSDSLAVFGVDQRTGQLTRSAHVVPVSRPYGLAFVRRP